MFAFSGIDTENAHENWLPHSLNPTDIRTFIENAKHSTILIFTIIMWWNERNVVYIATTPPEIDCPLNYTKMFRYFPKIISRKWWTGLLIKSICDAVATDFVAHQDSLELAGFNNVNDSVIGLITDSCDGGWIRCDCFPSSVHLTLCDICTLCGLEEEGNYIFV